MAGWLEKVKAAVRGNPRHAQSAIDPVPAPNPEPATGDPQQPGSYRDPLTPGVPQQAGEPGGPLDPARRPEDGGAPQGGHGEPLTEGGPTQQGEEHHTGTPGGDQPDTGGPGRSRDAGIQSTP